MSSQGSLLDIALAWTGVFSGQLELNIYCPVRLFVLDSTFDWIRLLPGNNLFWTVLLSGQGSCLDRTLTWTYSYLDKMLVWTGGFLFRQEDSSLDKMLVNCESLLIF